MSERGRVLLTGASGQVGGELRVALASLAEVVSPDRAQLDMADAAEEFRTLRAMVRRVQPRWIVNAAAYTAVDKAESEPELAYRVNRDAVRAVGEEAQRIGAAVIHFSTDYVFDGAGIQAYRETDRTGPLNVYGASKLAGEIALQESGAACLIFRTSWVFGSQGKNFLSTILKLARERPVLRVVADQYGAPTWSRDLAAMTARVMTLCEAKVNGGSTLSDVVSDAAGLYHASGGGVTTWHGFAAEAIRRQRERKPEAAWAEIQAISTAEYPTPARRPGNSRLDCSKLEAQFGWKMMDWQESLRKVSSEL